MTVPTRTALEVPQTGLGQALGLGLQKGVETGLQGLLKSFQQRQELKQKLALEQQKQQMKQQGTMQLLEQLGLGVQPGQGGLPGQPGMDGLEQPTQAMQPGQTEQIKKLATDPSIMTALAADNKPIADQIQQMYGNIIKQESAEKTLGLQERKAAHAEAKPFKDFMTEQMTSLPERKMAIFRVRDSMASPEKLKSLTNFWADYLQSKGLPGEYIRNNAAATLRSATKELLLTDLGRIKGARPNQFIMRELSASYPQAGMNPLAREKITLALEMGSDIMEKRIEIYDRISAEHEAQGKGIPGNIDRLVNKELSKFVNERQSILEKQYREMNKAGTPQGKKTALTVGQTFTSLPKNPPEGALVTKGNQTFVFRKGNWRKK